MEVYIGLLLVVFLIIIGVCYMQSSDNKTEEISNIITDENDETPFKNSTAKILNNYNNIAQNQRTDAIIDVLNKIRFWLTIIGIYFIVKIIIWAVIISTKGIIIAELLKMLSQNFF